MESQWKTVHLLNWRDEEGPKVSQIVKWLAGKQQQSSVQQLIQFAISKSSSRCVHCLSSSLFRFSLNSEWHSRIYDINSKHSQSVSRNTPSWSLSLCNSYQLAKSVNVKNNTEENEGETIVDWSALAPTITDWLAVWFGCAVQLSIQINLINCRP